MPLTDDLALLAGNTLVTAAVTDGWEAARRGVIRILCRGDPSRTQLAEQRLEDTRRQLTGLSGADLGHARTVLAERWAGWLADLLEEDPGAAADLSALLQEMRAALPAGAVAAAGYAVAAGQDVKITARDGGVAAGVIHGSVAPSGPARSGPGEQPAGPGVRVAAPGGVAAASGGIAAASGGIAAGHLENLNLTVEYHRPVVAGQPVRLPPRLALLAGREGLLAELDARLSAGAGPWPRTVALCGLGGAGKTSVAVEYAHRHRAEAGVVWQFAAEDATVLAAGFGELAAQLGARELADTRDPVASVHAVLAGYQPGWVLIFDNAADLASVAAFLPPAGPGRVLITSQNQSWPHGQALEVPVLGTEVAVEFLVSRSGDPDRQAAAELAGELGELPLALEQAASYIIAAGDSLTGYLASFRQRRADVLARGEPTGYGKTVATTWALAAKRLQQANPAALGLLRLMAFCAPESIPVRLLLQPRAGLAGQLGPEVAPVLVPLLEDGLAVADARAALRRYSLTRPSAGGLASVHRLVQAVTVDQMPQELAAAWRQAAAAVIEAAVPSDPSRPDTWRDFAALLPHAKAALTADSAGMRLIASYLRRSGSYAAARDLYQGMLEVRVRLLGPQHPQTLVARASVAHWTGKAGDAAGARDQFAALLAVYERVRGPEHPDTLTARAKLARFTGEAGDAAGARDQFAELLAVYERVLGPQHPDTLAAVRADRARFTGEAGDAAGARDQYTALLPVVEQVFGPEDPETVSDRGNLARFTGEAGDVAGARDQYAALLPLARRIIGPDHPNTLLTRASLARLTGEAGDPAGARDQFAALLPAFERVLGPEHPDTLWAQANLARWTGETGDPAGARDQFQALLHIMDRVLGPEHPDTVRAAQWHRRVAGVQA